MPAHDTSRALEREAHEVLRTIRCSLDDLAAVLEQLRQVRHAEASPDPRLIVEHGPCGKSIITAAVTPEGRDAVSAALAPTPSLPRLTVQQIQEMHDRARPR